MAQSILQKRPNIVLIMCDQMRGDCIGIAGHPDVKTPYLDSLADNELSNEMLAWGFRRGENHEQAVLDSESLKVVEKFNRNGNGKRSYGEFLRAS